MSEKNKYYKNKESMIIKLVKSFILVYNNQKILFILNEGEYETWNNDLNGERV